jgi:hypothetical protein
MKLFVGDAQSLFDYNSPQAMANYYHWFAVSLEEGYQQTYQ